MILGECGNFLCTVRYFGSAEEVPALPLDPSSIRLRSSVDCRTPRLGGSHSKLFHCADLAERVLSQARSCGSRPELSIFLGTGADASLAAWDRLGHNRCMYGGDKQPAE